MPPLLLLLGLEKWMLLSSSSCTSTSWTPRSPRSRLFDLNCRLSGRSDGEEMTVLSSGMLNQKTDHWVSMIPKLPLLLIECSLPRLPAGTG